jgi:hypothetical protein
MPKVPPDLSSMGETSHTCVMINETTALEEYETTIS